MIRLFRRMIPLVWPESRDERHHGRGALAQPVIVAIIVAVIGAILVASEPLEGWPPGDVLAARNGPMDTLDAAPRLNQEPSSAAGGLQHVVSGQIISVSSTVAFLILLLSIRGRRDSIAARAFALLGVIISRSRRRVTGAFRASERRRSDGRHGAPHRQ